MQVAVAIRQPDPGAGPEGRKPRQDRRDRPRHAAAGGAAGRRDRSRAAWTRWGASPRSPAIWSGAIGTEAMARGRFITIEGGEGAGKSTQAPLLVAALERAGIAALATREPGGSPGAEAIRRLLLEGDGERWDAAGEALLLVAARRDHVARLIEPALARGVWVVCDRFADSTLAYQGYGRGLTPADMAALHRFALGDFAPDLTLILDLPVEIGLARAALRRRRRRSLRAPRPRLPRTVAPRLPRDRRRRTRALRADRRHRRAGERCIARCWPRSRQRLGVRSRSRYPGLAPARGKGGARISGRQGAAARVDAYRRRRGGAQRRAGRHRRMRFRRRGRTRISSATRRPSASWSGCTAPGGCRMRSCWPGRAASARRRSRFASRAFLLAQGKDGRRGQMSLVGPPGSETGLAIDPDSGVFRRVAAGGHADLLTVERAWDPRRKRLRGEIVVEDTREIAAFLSADRGGGGVAGRHRRRRRGDEPQRRQRGAEDPRRAARPCAAAAGQPQSRPAAADDPLALPAADVDAVVAAARDPTAPPLPPGARRGRGGGAGGAERRQHRPRAWSWPMPAGSSSIAR